MGSDYKSTIFLPRTRFPMRGNLPQTEPRLLQRWQGLYRRLQQLSEGKELFILHDGPPYANGRIHIGTAVNKILKDVINRSWQMLGYAARYVPGWDCHGLPIEWKVEERYRAQGRDKSRVSVLDFRRECREFAQHWIEIQSQEFQRLGVLGDWDDPYTTMSNQAEAQIVREIHKFAVSGALYRGRRPVLWSVPERTALADAEVEYHELEAEAVWVRFQLVQGRPAIDHPPDDIFAGSSLVIWTTTPWTLPGNRAIAYSCNLNYGLYEVTEPGKESLARQGERLVVACKRAEHVAQQSRIANWRLLREVDSRELEGVRCHHPFHGQGYNFEVPVHAGDFVTDEVGTGLVHIAPAHGEDDFYFGQRFRLETPDTVGDDGSFSSDLPLFAGRKIYTDSGKPGDANAAVISALRDSGALLGQARIVHSYPCSWRSKSPLLFRLTSQWFISMEHGRLRERALEAIASTRWIPSSSRSRIESMVRNRPDWCISRQRLWGVPIAVFVWRKDGTVLTDPQVLERIASSFESAGSDAWFAMPAADLLGPEYSIDDFEVVSDIVDVWFESGSTHSFVLESRPELKSPASLYLEGSDQHRGWFQSSLLESCGTRMRAPFEAVFSHGFVLDEQGYKMSKSRQNTIAPQAISDQFGADILRLWVMLSDHSSDLRVGPGIIQHHAGTYRKLRNTVRYILGALHNFHDSERIAVREMPPFERWILHRMSEIDSKLRSCIRSYDFRSSTALLYQFCVADLSAFYLDVRKDILYCDPINAPRRRALRTVLDQLFYCLTAWLAPVLCFTAEEAWLARKEDSGKGASGDESCDDKSHLSWLHTKHGNAKLDVSYESRLLADSIHLLPFPDIPIEWRNESLAERFERARAIRSVITGALEQARARGVIGSSLQAVPVVHFVRQSDQELAAEFDMSELAITSSIRFSSAPAPADAFSLPEVGDVKVVFALAEGQKCARCWRILPEVDQICRRCAEAVQGC